MLAPVFVDRFIVITKILEFDKIITIIKFLIIYQKKFIFMNSKLFLLCLSFSSIIFAGQEIENRINRSDSENSIETVVEKYITPIQQQINSSTELLVMADRIRLQQVQRDIEIEFTCAGALSTNTNIYVMLNYLEVGSVNDKSGVVSILG